MFLLPGTRAGWRPRLHAVYITATGVGSWTNTTGQTVYVRLRGIGGGGMGYSSGTGAGGGAGAAFASTTILVPKGGIIYYNVGVGGGSSTTGKTWAQYNVNAAPSSSSAVSSRLTVRVLPLT